MSRKNLYESREVRDEWQQQHNTSTEKGSSLERMLNVLNVFTGQKPMWSVDEIASELSYTKSATYRYIRELTASDLLYQVETGFYSLGARIIIWDRQLRASDPLVRAARQMQDSWPDWGKEHIWLVCRLFKDQVVCVHQYGSYGEETSYERGMPRTLFRGATSKAILANLGARQHSRLFLEKYEEIKEGNLGENWDIFRRNMNRLRRQGYLVTAGEVDPNVYGIAAPLFDGDGRVIGSLSCVRPVAQRTDAATEKKQGIALLTLAEHLTQLIASFNESPAH